jgi:gluconolactonase
MYIKITLLLIFVALFSSAFSQEQQQKDIPSIVAKGAVLVKLSGDFSFTEGPAADGEGNVFFTDQPNDRIMEWTTSGEMITFMQPCGRSNGLFFDSKGNLWACAEEKNEIWKISPDKKVEKVIGLYNDRPFNGPNDLWITPEGGIFFTDPFYKRTWWDHSEMPQEKQCVYYLTPDYKSLKVVIYDMVQPNGIIGTPDGKTLYVADIGDRKTWSFSIGTDGLLSDKKIFCNMGSDGVTLDSEGNLYLTGNGVTVFDKTGKRLGNIPVPENWTANVCFGDKDRKTLYITASKGFYSIKTAVKGAY